MTQLLITLLCDDVLEWLGHVSKFYGVASHDTGKCATRARRGPAREGNGVDSTATGGHATTATHTV